LFLENAAIVGRVWLTSQTLVDDVKQSFWLLPENIALYWQKFGYELPWTSCSDICIRNGMFTRGDRSRDRLHICLHDAIVVAIGRATDRHDRSLRPVAATDRCDDRTV